jgi:beta-hydroxylase
MLSRCGNCAHPQDRQERSKAQSISMAKIIVLAIVLIFLASGMYMHLRGRVRHKAMRQLFDHSTFTAPINVFMLAFSRVPRTPYLPVSTFPELEQLRSHWQEIRDEALNLRRNMMIREAIANDDAGFNSFFKSGWKRFYLKWYGTAHPSALEFCPKTTALVSAIPSVKAAMFAELPPGAKLGLHRDPYSGSLRYHLALMSPNDDRCFINVDGTSYSWREGEGVIFDETYMHWVKNDTDGHRIVLLCDVERPMTNGLAQAVNRWVGTHVVAAASSPNQEGDPRGLISKLFKISFYAGQYRRRFKQWNPAVYKVTKFGLMLGVLALFIWWLTR